MMVEWEITGGMAGSLASQVVGNMTGNVKGINWKGVAQGGLAGLVGGIASGLGSTVDASGNALQGMAKLGQVALKSSAQVAGNYLVNKALYNQSFSWQSLAAGVAGSMAGSYAGDIAMPGLTTGAGQFAKNAFSSFAGGYTENRARVWMDVGGVRSTEQLLTDAFGNAIGNSMAGVHVKAAEKERMKQAEQASANAMVSAPPMRSFAGVGPIFDWRNKPMTYDYSGYGATLDWRNAPMTYDFSGYGATLDFGAYSSPDMANYGAILDYRSGDYDYSDTAMPDIGVCYEDSPVYSASSTNGVEMKAPMTTAQQAQAIAQAERTNNFINPSLRDSHWQYKVAEPVAVVGGAIVAYRFPMESAFAWNSIGVITNSGDIVNELKNMNYAKSDLRGFVAADIDDIGSVKLYAGSDYIFGGSFKWADAFKLGPSKTSISYHLRFRDAVDVLLFNPEWSIQTETDTKLNDYVSRGIRTNETGKTRIAGSVKLPVYEYKGSIGVFAGLDYRY